MKLRGAGVLVVMAVASVAQQDPPLRIPETVQVERDIVYARYGSREMRLDLYVPKSRAGAAIPAVVYIHGGGWRGGSKMAFSRQAAHMAALGFAGACIEYRLSGEAKWPAAIHDSKAAVRWVRANAKKYNIDVERVGAAGGSAGGHLAALLGTTHHLKELEGDGGNPGESSRVSAVAAFNPAVDLVSFGKRAQGNASNSVSDFLGQTYEQDAKLWELATPLRHASSKSAAFLFLHGTADNTVPYQQSADMRAKLKEAGVKAEMFTAEGAAHGFFNRPPWFEPTLREMEKFFLRVLR